MCGIFCVITCNECNVNGTPSCDRAAAEAECLEAAKRRGPDHLAERVVRASGGAVTCRLAGAVLWMQGDRPDEQPLADADGNLLLWNGECFNEPWDRREGESDTATLSRVLSEARSSEGETLQRLSEVRGPFAFVYYDASRDRLWFGRDRIGRHSLLWDIGRGGCLLTSAGGKRSPGLQEVPTIGIFRIDLGRELIFSLFPWTDCENIEEFVTSSGVDMSVSPIKITSPISQPPVFSQQPPPEDYDVLKSIKENCLDPHQILDKLMTDKSIRTRVTDLMVVLRASVKVRVETQPKLCKDCVANGTKTTSCEHCKVGVLFSGGLDSAILAALADEFVPENEPIDLVNVAFAKPKKPDVMVQRRGKKKQQDVGGDGSNAEDGFQVPDRVTGIQTIEELKRTRPHRTWNFIEANVTQEELATERDRLVSGLIHPLHTILDDSLGCALWFAARGRGQLRTTGGSEDDVAYESPARVLLLGMGADEQLGGYLRHRTALAHHGWPSLAVAMRADVDRIAARNLGRDDRVVSDSGRQGRLPYLDERVVDYLNGLPPWHKCFPVPELPPGVGDKLILRLAARSLGLENASVLPKRAFQFGSRIANSREKGSDKCDRLLS